MYKSVFNKIKKDPVASISLLIMIICFIGAIFLHQSILRKLLFIFFSISFISYIGKNVFNNSSSYNYSKVQLFFFYTYNLFYTISIILLLSTFISSLFNNDFIYRLCIVLFGLSGLINHVLSGTKDGFDNKKLAVIFILFLAILYLSYRLLIIL
jgi:hypothetical protein